MANFPLINAISKGIWLIEESYVLNQLPFIHSILQGKEMNFVSDPTAEYARKTEAEIHVQNIAMNAEGYDQEREVFNYWLRAVDGETGRINHRVDAYEDLPENSIAIIRNYGPMMKSDMFCGPAGSETKSQMIASANRSSKIVAIILETDSPGGHVDGTEVFADAVKKSKKPLVGYVNGIAASAGYWTLSGAKHIILGGKTSQVGSIGTMFSFMDIMPYYKDMGIKFHNVRATKSKDKNEDFIQMLQGHYDRIIKNQLDPLNELFIGNVKANRSKTADASEDVFTGNMYLAERAVGLGMGDAVGTFDDAIAKAYKLANKGSNSSATFMSSGEGQNNIESKTKQETMKLTNAWPAIKSFLGFGESVAEEDLPEITSEHLARVNKGIEDAQAENVTLKGENVTLKAEVAELTTEKEALEAQVIKLGAQPGVMPSNPESNQDVIETSAEVEEQKKLDAMPHNQEADSVL